MANGYDSDGTVAGIKRLRMKIFKLALLFFLILIGVSKEVRAQGTEYRIENLESKLVVQKDYSLLVEITIKVDFSEKSRGMIWYVPYSDKIEDKGKSESQNNIKILAITDGNGELLPYKVEYFNLDKKITIGDANKTVIGKQVYRIKYLRKEVVKEVDNQMEIEWGVVGEYRKGQIDKTKVVMESPYFKIQKVEILKKGTITSQKHDLKIENNKIWLDFNLPIQSTDDLMIKTSLEKTNSFQTKQEWEKWLNNKKTILYTSLLALVMISTAVLIQKRS